MYLSASQLRIVYPVYEADDLTACTKKYYKQYVKKLPTPKMEATSVGSITHACIETYLEYPDNVDGSPFTEGWDKELTPMQSERVKELIKMGIEELKIVKQPERHIELPLYDGGDIEERIKILGELKPNWNEEFLHKAASSSWEILPNVFFTGFIDLFHSGNTITDWKTSSDPERYGLTMDKKSPKYVARDLQLNIYASYLRKVKGVEGPIKIGHTYLRTKGKVQVVEKYVEITPEHIDKFYEWLTLEAIPNFQKIWNMSEGEINALPVGEKACEKYRGCPFQKLCSGALTEPEYIRMMQIKKEYSTMGLMDKIKAREQSEKNETTPKEKKVTKPKEKKVTTPKPGHKKVEATVQFDVGDETGFDLIIGASVRSSASKYTTLTQFFNEVTEGMLKELDEKNWFDLDPFKRREMFHTAKDEILKMAQGKVIIARFLEPDLQALMNVLYDSATTVIEGGMR